MSIFRGITANSMIAGRSGDLVHLETTPEVADQQGIMIDLTSITDGAAIVISLADGRELAGWLIEHCVEPLTPLHPCSLCGGWFALGPDGRCVNEYKCAEQAEALPQAGHPDQG